MTPMKPMKPTIHNLVVSSEILGKKKEVIWDGQFDSAIKIIISFAGASPVHNPPSQEFKELYAAAAVAKLSMTGSIQFNGTLVNGQEIDLKVEKEIADYQHMLNALGKVFSQVGS